MMPTVVVRHAKAMFPYIFKNVVAWFPNGKNCIRLRLNTHKELIFTYHDDDHWVLETATHYLDNMKGDKSL